jgi:gamma-glutamylcyclotransferase (GGCT)/AIG2-like uncharacterized protein YtfP
METSRHGETDGPDIRLATYGTLAPGRPNYSRLSDLRGRWLAGHVRGLLVDHWHRLDAFEGPGYRRVTVDVRTEEGLLPASIYVLARPADPS